MKKKKAYVKILAMVLTLSLTLTMFSGVPTFAQEASDKEQLTEKGELWQPEENSDVLNCEGDLSLQKLKTAKLAEEDKPEIVSQESIDENGHVNRLWAQEEDLNSIVFQNRDGTKTMYYYAEPVKYTDENGKVKDKKNKLTDTGNQYTNAENDINSYFPKKVHKNKGVILRHEGIEIELAPLVNGSSGASRQTGHNKDGQNTDYVEYPNVFDEKISLRYTPTFNGYKEDIIIQENVGINEFQFKITTGGLQLTQENGFVYLSNPLTGEIVASIGDIVVYDSAPILKETVQINKSNSEELSASKKEHVKTYTHSYDIQTITADQEYILTMIVDKDYLSDTDRVYPVYVDPTIKIEENNRIQDATIYSNYNVNDGNNQYLYVGYQGSKGTARSLVRFPGLMNHSTLKNIPVEQIKSVEYIPIELHRGTGLRIDAYAATQYWTQSGVKFSNTIWNAYGDFIDKAYMTPYGGTDSDGNNAGTGNWYPFDITNIYKSWRNGQYGGVNNHYGIMLKAYQEGSTTVAQLGSAQHSSLFPSVMVNYNTIPVSQVSLELTELTLNVNDTYYLEASVVPSYATNKAVYYVSSNTSVVNVGHTSGLVCANGVGTAIITVTSVDGGYKAYCQVTVSAASSELILNQARRGYIAKGEEYLYKFTPSKTREYAFYTSSSIDTYGELFQGDNLLKSDDDSANQNNFCIVQKLVAGTEYSLKVKGYSNSYGNYVVSVSGNWSTHLTNTNNNINSNFDRSLARSYMDAWAQNPNTEEYISIDDNDCANYTSQCLFAGGLGFVGAPTSKEQAAYFKNDVTRWYYCPEYADEYNLIEIEGYSYTWTSVENFQKFWGKKADGTIGKCYQYIEYDSPSHCLSDISYLSSVLQPGDILQYTGNNRRHNMIVSKIETETGNEDILFSAHSIPRLDASFKDLVLQNEEYKKCKIHIIRIKQN